MSALTTCFYSDHDIAALLETFEAFADTEIALRWQRPEIAITPADLKAILEAAHRHGLLDATMEGYGLWAELVRNASPQLTLTALTALARRNASAALLLHQLALAQAARTLLPAMATTMADTATPVTELVLTGAQGWGRSSLVRWLHEQPNYDDIELLKGNYTATPAHSSQKPQLTRLLWVAPMTDNALVPIFENTQFYLAQVSLETPPNSDLLAHGMDGLRVKTCGKVQWQIPLDRQSHTALITAHLLGLAAIALGITQCASFRANDYAGLRIQGGRQIIKHDAVAALISEMESAMRATSLLLAGACQPRVNQTNRFVERATALAIKHECLPLLCRAVNAAMQIHGGMGYMRETGIENLLRDINCLRLLGGSPAELALMLAAERLPSAAQTEKAGSADALPGFVPPGSLLAPLPAFRRLPLLRVLSAYTPENYWQRDTNGLPAALANYRERLRDFADCHIRPHALALDQQLGEHTSVAIPQQPAVIDSILQAAGRAGLLSDLLPRPLGSAQWTRYRHSLVWQQSIRTEELARADGGIMLLLSAHNLGLAPVLFSGNWQVLKEVVLPALKACERGEPQLFAFAITEPAAGSDAEEGHGAQHNKPGLVAHPAPGGWRLRGRKVFISGGDRARWVVAFAALAGEGYASWTAFLIDTQQAGFVRVRNEHKMGMRASSATELECCDCFVPDARVLGGLRNGWALSRATLNFSRLPVAGMAVGFAQAATDIATDHACRQRLGGKPLMHYQHMQLGIADLQATTASIRALVWEYARAWTPWQSKASIAKFHATDQAQCVIERAMDLCGEQGLLHGFGLEKTFRDNRLTRIFEGTNQINRLSVIEDQQGEFLDRIRQCNCNEV